VRTVSQHDVTPNSFHLKLEEVKADADMCRTCLPGLIARSDDISTTFSWILSRTAGDLVEELFTLTGLITRSDDLSTTFPWTLSGTGDLTEGLLTLA